MNLILFGCGWHIAVNKLPCMEACVNDYPFEGMEWNKYSSVKHREYKIHICMFEVPLRHLYR